MNAPRSLSALIDQAMTVRGVTSGRRLADLAQREGFVVSHATINAIRGNSYKSRPTDDTVRAIAWLARVSDEVAFRAAGLRVPGPPLAEELPPGVDNLSPEARKAVIGVLRVLVQQEEVVGDAQEQEEAAPMNEIAARAGAIAAGVLEAGGDPAHVENLVAALLANRGSLETPVDDLRAAAYSATAPTWALAARPGTPRNPPDTVTGEESQDTGSSDPA